MLKKILFISLIFVTSYSNSFSETYYVSNSGSDSFNGISPVFPFKTLDKINEVIYKMKPGDAILFERGGVFFGQINLSSSGSNDNPILIGAYGNGKNPVISGSIPVSNWSRYKGNIYSSEITGNAKNLIVNNNQMKLARYPNSGYLTIDNPLPDPKKGFTDKDLKQSAGYWEGSIARIRTINWAYEYSSIKSFKNSSMIFETPTFYPVQKGWGYYLDNNLNELDTAGEWFYSKGKNENGTVYFNPPNGSDINNLFIQASIYDYGIFSYKDIKNVIIQDIEISGQSIAGIYLAKSVSNTIIENCTLKNIIQLGITFPNSSKDCKFINNRFYNINGKALFLANINKSKVSANIFLNIGMIPGYGTTGDPFPMSAIQIVGSDNLISGNNLNTVGHDGINSLGSGNVVEKNVIKNCLLLLNDGGAIKCYGDYSKNSVWKNNFIFNVKGNIENTAGVNSILAKGIYLDDLANNMSIVNNTITNSGLSGIGINNGFDNFIHKNICFDNFTGLNFYQNLQSKNNRISDNIIVGNNKEQYSIDIKYLGGSNIPGKFDSNFYFNPVNNKSFLINYKNKVSEVDFEKWRSLMKSDMNTKLITGRDVEYPQLYTNMSDDSLKVILKTGFYYKEINQNSVYGSVDIAPWSSEVLFVNSEIKNLPELYVAGETLNFGNVEEGNTSDSYWYNLIGKNLSNPIIVNSPAGFEVSIDDDSGFSNTITLMPVNGKIDIIIFVRFVPDSEKKYYDFILNKSESLISRVKIFGNSR